MVDMSPRARWIGLLFISIAVSLIIVDSTIVNVAIALVASFFLGRQGAPVTTTPAASE